MVADNPLDMCLPYIIINAPAKIRVYNQYKRAGATYFKGLSNTAVQTKVLLRGQYY